MKKLFFSIWFLIMASYVFAQHPVAGTTDSFALQTIGSSATLVKSKGAIGSDSGFVNAKYADTTAANRGKLKNYPGAQIRVGDSIWMRNNTATKWLNITGSGGTSSPLLLQTNGVTNGDQTILNLQQGTNIVLTDNGSGQVTVDGVPFDTSILRGVYMDTSFAIDDTTTRYCKGGTCWDITIHAGTGGGGTIIDVTGTDNYGFHPIVTGTTTKDVQVSTLLTSGSVPFIGTNGALRQNNSNFFWDSTNARLGLRTTTPAAALQVGNPVIISLFTGDSRIRVATQGMSYVSNAGTDAADNAGFFAAVSSNEISRFPFFSSSRSRGAPSSPSATLSNDTLLRVGGGGFDGTNWTSRNTASVEFMAGGDFDSASHPTYINFYTTDTTDVQALRASISPNGEVRIVSLSSGGTAPVSSGTAKMVTTDANGKLSFATIPGGGAGTVTSVDATVVNTGLAVSGSPITTSGTLAFTWTGAVQGDLPYFSATNTLSFLNKNASATRYLSNTGTSNNPAWAQVDLTNGVTGTLPFGNGGTGQTSYTDGQLLIGNTATGGLSKATLTAGSNITITNGNGTISIASTGGGSSFTRQIITSGSSGTVTGGNYIVTIDPASTLAAYTLTMPASPSDLDVVEVDFGGTVTSGTIVTALIISANSGQTILDNTPPVNATADNTLLYRYRAANTTWYRFKP